MYTVTITVSGGLITGVYAAGAGPQDIRAVVVDYDNKPGSGEPEAGAEGDEWGGYEEEVRQLEADLELLELSRAALACEKCGEVECCGACTREETERLAEEADDEAAEDFGDRLSAAEKADGGAYESVCAFEEALSADKRAHCPACEQPIPLCVCEPVTDPKEAPAPKDCAACCYHKFRLPNNSGHCYCEEHQDFYHDGGCAAAMDGKPVIDVREECLSFYEA
jgi:hypothetical protein